MKIEVQEGLAKNEMKFASEVKKKVKNEVKIPGCDYWGTYNGYKVYKCYSKTAPNYSDFIFAIGTNLYMNGKVVGKVDSAGHVTLAPKQVEPEPVVFDSNYNDNVVSSAEELLELALKRTIEDLVGPSLANW